MGAQGSSSGQLTGLEPRRRGFESHPLRQFNFRDHASYQQSWEWLVRNLEHLIEELVYYRVLTGRVAVWVGYRDGRAGEGTASLQVPTNRSWD
jgi:hypothetical protein